MMTDTATPPTEALAAEVAAPQAAAHAPHVQVVKPEHTGARVTVLLQPEEKHLSLPRPKTSRQLLAALGLAEETALVARDPLASPPKHPLRTFSISLKRRGHASCASGASLPRYARSGDLPPRRVMPKYAFALNNVRFSQLS